MIVITDTTGIHFYLLKTINRDRTFFAYWEGTKNAYKRAQKSAYGQAFDELPIYSHNSSGKKYYVTSVTVTVGKGLIALGCHHFDRKNSTILRKWILG